MTVLAVAPCRHQGSGNLCGICVEMSILKTRIYRNLSGSEVIRHSLPERFRTRVVARVPLGQHIRVSRWPVAKTFGFGSSL